MIDWIVGNWNWVLLVFFVLEKIVKVTPFEWDDILVDGVKWLIWRVTGKPIPVRKG